LGFKLFLFNLKTKNLNNSYEYIFIIKTMEVVIMPRFDGTGPEGEGPKTGRQMGKCEGAQPRAMPCWRSVGFSRRFRRRAKTTETN
jgi:hypothetical protein